MGPRPNAMLILKLTPDDLPRKTFVAICKESGFDPKNSDNHKIKIGDLNYRIMVAKDCYDDEWQMSANEGQIILHDFLTYGYGEDIAWSEVARRASALEEWAKKACERHSCTYRIYISANYW